MSSTTLPRANSGLVQSIAAKQCEFLIGRATCGACPGTAEGAVGTGSPSLRTGRRQECESHTNPHESLVLNPPVMPAKAVLFATKKLLTIRIVFLPSACESWSRSWAAGLIV
ncbi:hypothetical protein XENTR_v10004863 [Xenopus tropicalis]|nr:hypothetical protein XENTR_v10004863 [Xenopus tropicalis]